MQRSATRSKSTFPQDGQSFAQAKEERDVAGIFDAQAIQVHGRPAASDGKVFSPFFRATVHSHAPRRPDSDFVGGVSDGWGLRFDGPPAQGKIDEGRKLRGVGALPNPEKALEVVKIGAHMHGRPFLFGLPGRQGGGIKERKVCRALSQYSICR
jgi:hypothetical protein